MTTTRRRKTPGFMRSVLAKNLKALIDHHYCDIEKPTNRYIKLAKKTGMSVSSIQRFVNAQQGASIDTIETLAYAFDLSPYHLLLPNLEVENPQVVAGAMAGERAMYMKFMREVHKRES
jgi:transcriptional regulator with XRE-family HTH domain